MNRYIYLLVISSFVMISCNKIKKNVTVKTPVVTSVIQTSDTTAYLIIKNEGEADCYIPSDYHPCFTLNDDSVHFEGFENPKYNITNLYVYKKILPEEIVTTEKIGMFIPDSAYQYVEQTYFNQFRVLPMQILKKDSTLVRFLKFDIPKKSRYATVVYYYHDFEKDTLFKKGNYLFEDFIKFNDINAKYAYSRIYNCGLNSVNEK